MSFLGKLRIGTKLAIAFGAMIVLVMLLAGAALQKFYAMSSQWTAFDKVTLAKRITATEGDHALGDGIHHFKNYILRGGDYNKKFSDDMNAIEKAVSDYRKLGTMSPQEESDLQAVLEGVKHYREGMARLTELRTANTPIADLDKSVAGADKEIGKPITRLISVAHENTKKASAEMHTLLDNAQDEMAVLTVVIALLGIGFAYFISRIITRPLQEAVVVADAVAKGDLTQHIEVNTRDETGQLLQALKDMNESLSGIVGDVRGSTDSITTAAKQIAAGNSDLSQRTEEQASSLEETASSMEELTSTVKQNAENAKQANQLAITASNVAVKGGAVVGEVVGTMASISDSSKKIVDIISVIEGIAFQTNILALNAAVEAARAGEQGRGFAVVAGEVRNLAQRSAAAAKEIKTLIGDSVDKVDAGAKLVDQAGTTMNEIVSAVKRVTDIMAEISAASSEQSAGIEQVNQAITQMDEVTQQNAALVEEAAAAAESMEEQAGVLMEAVSIFKLEAGGGRTRSSAAKPAGSAGVALAASTHRAVVRSVTPVKKPARQIKAKPAAAGGTDANDGEWAEF
ncbi:MAG: HAMP domain-containing protein [Betaproteobacteria bacterium]|nr:HAMP domain-containing protein [Betaproteobacteria bacterium]